MRNLFAALVLTLACGCVSAESDAPGPALFVASDADSTLYLYGTIHLRRAGDAWGSAAVEEALQSSDEIWTELEISPEADARTQRLALQYGAAPPGRPLSSWLSAEQNAQLAAALRDLGLPMQAVEGMQPWLAGLTLTIIPMVRAGYDPNAGVDRAVDAFGDAHGKRMRWLETPEQQLGFFANLSEEVQVQVLLESIGETQAGVEMLDAMSAAWERGDVAALDRLLNDEMRGQYPEVYDVLIKRRNNAWAEAFAHELEGAGVDFVAVGAAHIIGGDGLVAQLRARGYRVERVPVH